MSKKVLIWLVPVLVLAVGAGCFLFLKKKPEVAYRTAAVERGDIAVQVTASGTLNPFTTVLVGTQVSGTVSKLFADFNSHVKKGQIVALLDTTLLFAALQDSKASLEKAAAQMRLSRQICERTRVLFTKGLIAQADLDQAVSDSVAATSGLSSARAQLDRAKINLRYATIISPITGVVIARNVDVGQTVAASFNTPTLFTISDDLTKMQVQSSIDEADIGQVRVGQAATFTVDAYPARIFKGTVSQIRLSPTTVQNVVTYTVMVDLDNEDMALLPGMTANITVNVQKTENVLKVPVAALKFKPAMTGGPGGPLHKPQGGTGMGDTARKGPGGFGKSGDRENYSGNAPGDTAKLSQRHGAAQDSTSGRVFVLTDGKLSRVSVKIGLSSGGFTAVEGDLQAGQQVVVGIMNNDKSKTPSQQLIGGGGAPGMGRRF
jgi:HlyD family secretion protein